MKKKLSVYVLVLFGIGTIAFFLFTNNATPTEEENKVCYFGLEENLTITHGKELTIPILSNEKIKTLELRIGDSLVSSWKNPTKKIQYILSTGSLGVGTVSIVLVAKDMKGKEIQDERVIQILSDIIPEQWSVKINAEYPHLDSSFTQGLAFSGNDFFESTGDPNKTGSTLVGEIDLQTGNIRRRTTLDASYFGEGLTIMDKQVFQITWTNQKCFVYNQSDFSKVNTYTYTGEGWGICNDGKSLIMSDGSERLTFRDPKTFEVQKTIEVYTNEGAITKLNELEYIDGYVYANIWTKNLVAVIDPQKGKVIAIIDATELATKGKGNGEVMNGIAYNSISKKTYMTGKFWPKLFEVEILKKVKAS